MLLGWALLAFFSLSVPLSFSLFATICLFVCLLSEKRCFFVIVIVVCALYVCV